MAMSQYPNLISAAEAIEAWPAQTSKLVRIREATHTYSEIRVVESIVCILVHC